MLRRFVLSCALMLGTLALAAPAKACDGCGYGGVGYGFGLGWMYNSLEESVPHFAAHPPVYYSYPVPRTYGYSPWAYPPHFRTPDVVMEVEPLSITNPYVPSSDTKAEPEAEQTVSARQPQPLVINNPYVSSGPAVASAAKAD